MISQHTHKFKRDIKYQNPDFKDFRHKNTNQTQIDSANSINMTLRLRVPPPHSTSFQP